MLAAAEKVDGGPGEAWGRFDQRSQVLVERQPFLQRVRAGESEGDGHDRVSAEPGLVRRAIQPA